jgi:hypothetical protein
MTVAFIAHSPSPVVPAAAQPMATTNASEQASAIVLLSFRIVAS